MFSCIAVKCSHPTHSRSSSNCVIYTLKMLEAKTLAFLIIYSGTKWEPTLTHYGKVDHLNKHIEWQHVQARYHTDMTASKATVEWLPAVQSTMLKVLKAPQFTLPKYATLSFCKRLPTVSDENELFKRNWTRQRHPQGQIYVCSYNNRNHDEE